MQFRSLRSLSHSSACEKKTPELNELYKLLNASLTDLCKNAVDIRNPLFLETVQQNFALQWLELHSRTVSWKELLYYFSNLSHRTYENRPVMVNLVVSAAGDQGGRRIDLAKRQKFLDQLATSPFTYFRVDQTLKFVNFEEVLWDDIPDATSYKYLPEFLYPFHCTLKQGEFSAHLTAAGDWIFMDSVGLLASRRRGSWKVYDKATLKNALGDSLGDYYVGANMFEIAFDLSFKRHGALLVYDPDHKVIDKVVNKDSRVSPQSEVVAGSGQALVAPSVRDIAIGKSTKALRQKRLLTELASIDGAVVFDDNQLLAIGAIIQSHDQAGDQSGARTTAALSAYHWGGHPVKVSSDGEVAVYFTSADKERGKSCDAALSFL